MSSADLQIAESKDQGTNTSESRYKFSSFGRHTFPSHYSLNFLGCMGWQRKGANILPQSESVFPVDGICPYYLLKC